MLSDKDYERLDEVFLKLKQADNTCSDVVLDCEEVRVLVDDNVLYIVRQICLI